MSSTVCQGLQSCLEPQILEPRVFGLKLASHISHFPKPHSSTCVSDSESDIEESEHNKNNPNVEFGGWGFIESLKKKQNEEKQKLYVHPLVKRSSSTLSKKSLELCTENLGSETGTDIGDNYSDISSSDSESGKFITKRERGKLVEIKEDNKVNLHRSFPPPLTSMNSSNCIYFRPHREDGRLVIKAVASAPSQSCFQAERGDGCLKIRFVKDYNLTSFEEENFVAEEEDEDEDEEEEEESDDSLGEDIDGNNENDDGEMGIGKFQRPRRCMESGPRNKEGFIWGESCWLAT